jgi:hypothetical protein
LRAKSNEDLPRAEYRQFDAETLAVIANLGSSSNENTQRISGLTNSLTNSLTIATGNHSQFVFCLTNPCENGGTCFVTNTATTKVRRNLKTRISIVSVFFVSRAFVFVVMDLLVIIVKLLIIEQ